MAATCPGCDLNSLLPPSVAQNTDEAAFELVRAVMIRSTYIPGVRHRLGWCGINESINPGARPGSITAKLNDRPGVFALHPVELIEPTPMPGPGPGPENISRFSLSYFPAPEEDLVENFSIEAGIQALDQDYMGRVRQFSQYPELTALFHIGVVECMKADHGVFISFQSNERLGWISRQGIELKTQYGPVQAVEPGGIDQDLPAFELCRDFFRSLAASFTYTLGESPSIFYSQRLSIKKQAPNFLRTHEQRWTIGYFSNGKAAVTSDLKHDRAKEVWFPPMPVPCAHKNELWWSPNLAGADNSLDKKAMGITAKPRFILLTGFLGTGKTSFLDHFIQAQTAANNFVAVVQNEIGEKGLDAVLLDQTYAVTQMDEGCVCCSLSGNLRAALSDILDRFQPDFIVLETTGLANPANILREIEDLDDLLEFGSITTIVDSRQGSRTLDRFEVARAQVRLADVVLVNKCDLAGSDQDTLKGKIHQLNPAVAIHLTSHGDIHPGLLYGVNFRSPVRRPIFSAMGTHATHNDDRIETRLIDLDRPLNPLDLKTMIQNGGDKILRVKGIAEFEDQSGPMVFQYAPGIYRITKFTGKDIGERFLVVIGQDLENSFDDKKGANYG